jgi:hypothetical protein
MIVLQDFFDTLASSEFAGMAMGKSVLDTITADKYPKIVANMNLGLIELYKRFTLKEKEVTLYEQTGLNHYLIRSDYISNSAATVSTRAYLVDPSPDLDPFEDDLIKITDAYNGDVVSNDYQKQLHLNNKQYSEKGLFTTAFDTVKLMPADPVRIITLSYLASYPKIVITDDFNPSAIELYFPDWIQEPLLSYIAARVFQGKASRAAEGEKSLYTTFMYHYENACKRIELLGLAEMTNDTCDNFEKNGWV